MASLPDLSIVHFSWMRFCPVLFPAPGKPDLFLLPRDPLPYMEQADLSDDGQGEYNDIHGKISLVGAASFDRTEPCDGAYGNIRERRWNEQRQIDDRKMPFPVSRGAAMEKEQVCQHEHRAEIKAPECKVLLIPQQDHDGRERNKNDPIDRYDMFSYLQAHFV